MTINTIVCDRCGFESTEKSPWYETVKKIVVKTPPDGINGGYYEMDLCASCRRQLDKIMSKFFVAQAPSEVVE